MPAFKYMAKDLTGKDINGVIESPSVGQVVSELKKQGLIVLNVEDLGNRDAQDRTVQDVVRKRKGTRKKIKVRDLAVMCRQLATMLKAGLPLIDALDTIGEETENLNLADSVRNMRDDIEGGSTFSEAINKYPKIYSLMFRAMIEAGEASGSLSHIIGQLAITLKKQDALNRKIKSATMYPKFVFGFFFAIVAVVMLFLMPQFEGIFFMFARPCQICADPTGDRHTGSTGYVLPSEPRGQVDMATMQYQNQFPENSDKFWIGVSQETPGAQPCPRCEGVGKRAPLPAFTETLLKTSRLITGNIIIVLAIIIGLIVLWKQWSQSEKGQKKLQKILMKLPVVGPLIIKASAARFCLSLSTLLHNGVPLDQALDITGRVSGNVILETSTESIRENIIQGGGLADGMKKHPIFPELVVKMVAVGEESGALSDMLTDIAEYYNEEVSQTVEGISSIIEPLMIVLIGAVVAVIVLGLYLPIFNLGRAIQGG